MNMPIGESSSEDLRRMLKHVPKWLLVIVVTCVLGLYTYAIVTERPVAFWPPSIGCPSGHSCQSDLDCQDECKDDKYISRTKAIEKFPKQVQQKTLTETASQVLSLIEANKRKDSDLTKLKNKIEGLEGNFLYRLLSFHRDAGCFGDSLNFTYLRNDEQARTCEKKAALAKRFLGFLAEIRFYDGSIEESPTIAEKQLTKYQES
uniref:Uncharacterized protein n=1 Tax=Candidatus Kentrum sp. LPFa TaxID=2126335 RepID=A0A450WT25_9GAMM|nr:MAG: hypothetical protein BECKLPF1236A_GA0070988_102494 [Candidatus Kentron sp. LPFa]VFK34620.1 MAG: hypothetical protein BECKLPF1236C_GA0070990_102853 [Candidatus Kentron sp. LPFa]